MIILGIETSCDETAAALVKDGRKIISQTLATSKNLQKKFGGIIPEQAAREQLKCIIPVIQETFLKALSQISKIDALAVVNGPGLIGSLLIGLETAKTLSLVLQKPLVAANHLLTHLYANFLVSSSIKFPALGLVASGGHTELVLLQKHGVFQAVGSTQDDAAGECLDKCARIMGLSYPGGPAIEKLASLYRGQKYDFKLPRPMVKEKKIAFSFSGLKTAVYYLVKKLKKQKQWSKKQKICLAYELEEAVADTLAIKTYQAFLQFPVNSLLLGGGVIANKKVRKKIALIFQFSKKSIKIFAPPPLLCTDNAAMVASYAYFNFKPINWEKIKAQPNLTI